ncbi:MAG: hypothetical protein ABWY29_06105, partial [Blastococcus sp.]
MARLTAAQALEIGAGVLAVVAERTAPGSDRPGGEQVVDDPVVATDGRVVPGPTANGGLVGS